MSHKNFTPGTQISINVGGAVGHGVVAVEFIHGEIEAETPKAIKVRNDGGFVWFPKKAIVPAGTDWFKTASWFRPSNPFFFERMVNVGGVSAEQ